MRLDEDIEPPVVVPWRSFWRVFFAPAGTLIILFLIIAWHSRWPYYEIPSEKITDRFVRNIHCRDGNPHALEVHVSGHIDGYATFITPHREFNFQPGNINIETGGEHYEGIARLEYIPENVTEGHLIVKYKFRTF